MVDAKKSLGQHWLNDVTALKAMVSAARVGSNDVVLEIGPGLGSLTVLLVESARKVVAVEYDDVLALQLPYHIQNENLEIIQGDILKFDFGALPPNYKVVANIPYYLTSNLIRLLCEAPNHFSTAALLIQKEVAERAAAGPGNTSLLSISIQYYCEVSLGEIVPASLFEPPPKVDSRILKLEYRKQSLFADVDTKEFFRLVKAGFSERRKKLRSSLSGGLGITKEDADRLLSKAGIDGSLRAQALSLKEWHKLYEQMVS